MSKPSLGTCQATGYVEGAWFNLRRAVRLYDEKPCERAAKEQVGSLCLCTTHARMARDGWISEDGHNTTPADRAEWKRKRGYQRPYNWAKDL